MDHGVVCRLGRDRFGYFGWPSVARMDDGTLVVGCSGLREEHKCPYGRSVIFFSHDDGAIWSLPRVVNDSPIDDRDVGVVSLGGRRLLLTWFSSTSADYGRFPEHPDWLQTATTWTEDLRRRWTGSFVRISDDGGENWGAMLRVPVSAPHGPILLNDGRLLYLGKAGYNERLHGDDRRTDPIQAHMSADGGQSWQFLGQVPPLDGATRQTCLEAHVVELPSGKLIGMVRFQTGKVDPEEAARWRHLSFSLCQTESEDGGRTWTPMRHIGAMGAPPHLLRHSSGALVCVYGYRRVPYGQRAIVSRDDGQTWSDPLVLREDGPTSDLGYPASVELPDRSIFTVYYQKQAADEKASLLWSRWRLPR